MGVLLESAAWLSHAVCSGLYLMFAAGVVVRNPRALLNRLCGLLILTFALWCACLAVSHHPGISKSTARQFYDVGSLAWGTFASQALLFAAAFARRRWLRAPWFWAVLLLPAAGTVYAQNAGLLAADYLERPWGWAFVWADDLPVKLFFAYYATYMLATLFLFGEAARGDPAPVRRRQASIIFNSSLLPLLLGSITDVALPMLGIYRVPNCAPEFTIIWIAGLAYAVVRYHMLELGPRVAADEVVATMSDALLLVDREGRIAWPNPAASRLFGRSEDELRRSTLDALLGRRLPHTLAGQAPDHEEATYVRPDGTSFELALSFSPLKGSMKETAGWVCLATDVTLQKRAQTELRRARDELERRVATRTAELEELNRRLSVEVTERRRSEEHHRRLIDSMHEGVWVLDVEDRTTLVNDHLAQLLGRTPDSLLGTSVRELIDPASERACDELLRDVHEARPRRADWQLRGADDRRLSTIVQASPLTQDGAGYRGCVLTVMDVTEREAMQAQLARTRRLASVGLLAAGVGHEINNPLTYVSLNLEQIKTLTENQRARAQGMATFWTSPDAASATGAGPLWDELAELAGEALEGARRVQDIVRELRRFSRGEPQSVEPVDVHDALESAIKMGHHQVRFRAKLVREFDTSLPAVVANTGSLSQVFLNLLVNAAQAIPEDGKEHVVRIRTSREGENVLIEFADTGRGISPEEMERLFDPFFSTKAVGEGLGLGLAISHEIITSLGGRIFVGSELGRGSRFLVALKVSHEEAVVPEPSGPSPLAPALLLPTSPSASVEALASKPALARVLVIDDEELVARTVERVLRAHYDVVVATSGEEARRMIGSKGPFDVALCDLMMPGMSGMALAAWVADHAPSLRERMVFMTGGAFSPEATRFLEQARHPVLEKPFVPAEVLRAVETVLDGIRA